MKTLLLLLLYVGVAHADFMQDRALKDAGEKPLVTEEKLPGFIAGAIKAQLKDPASAEFLDWTQPELQTMPYAGQRLGFWSMKVTVRAKNSYGAVTTQTYLVVVKQGRVEQVRR